MPEMEMMWNFLSKRVLHDIIIAHRIVYTDCIQISVTCAHCHPPIRRYTSDAIGLDMRKWDTTSTTDPPRCCPPNSRPYCHATRESVAGTPVCSPRTPMLIIRIHYVDISHCLVDDIYTHNSEHYNTRWAYAILTARYPTMSESWSLVSKQVCSVILWNGWRDMAI